MEEKISIKETDQIKKQKYQIKRTFNSNQDVTPLFQKFHQYQSAPPSNPTELSHNFNAQDKVLKCTDPKTADK